MNSTPVSLSHPPVKVSAKAFRDAASQLPGARRPRGSAIPKDTILQPDRNGVSVETPVMASVVHTTAPWRVTVSIDAKRLLEVCAGFRKIGAFRSVGDEFELSVVAGQLRVKFQTSAVSIPLL